MPSKCNKKKKKISDVWKFLSLSIVDDGYNFYEIITLSKLRGGWYKTHTHTRASQMAQMVNNLPSQSDNWAINTVDTHWYK